MASTKSEWFESDVAFLRSLRIVSSDPPPPLPRFRVEAAKKAGDYRVIDALHRYRPRWVFSSDRADPRAAAESLARQLNEQHATASKVADKTDGPPVI